jgi:calcineurin-like phosphoesterase family protein
MVSERKCLMSNLFYISDLHFGHANILTFKRADGTPLRDFTDLEHMHSVMEERWNAVVRERDTVYVLGDVAIARRGLQMLSRLRGRKVLIKGNHDIFKLADYTEHFADIRAYDVKQGLAFSHIPVHPESLARFGCNVHGHLHYREVLDDAGNPDPRYFNVSCERLDFIPLSREDLHKAIVARGGVTGFKNGNGPQEAT